MLEESKEEVTVLVGEGSPEETDAAGRGVSGVRAAKSFESRKGEE